MSSSAFSPTCRICFFSTIGYYEIKYNGNQSKGGIPTIFPLTHRGLIGRFPWRNRLRRFVREREKVKLWRDRSEKLAKQCAMAMANGREDRQGRWLQQSRKKSKGRWRLKWWCIDSWIKCLEDSGRFVLKMCYTQVNYCTSRLTWNG